MTTRPIRPPEKYLDWFDRSANGIWVAARSREISARIKEWSQGRGRRVVWLLTPVDRRSIREWVAGKYRISWRCISCLVTWSGFTAEYWLGAKPATTTRIPYPKHKPRPEELPAIPVGAEAESAAPQPALDAEAESSAPAFVIEYSGPWFVDNGHGNRALALGLIPGFMQRFDDYFGLGFAKHEGRVPDWLKCAVRQWRIGKYRPSEEMVQRLCDWTQTNLRWWCIGQGACKAPQIPPPPKKAPRANTSKPEKPQKSKAEAPAYNFFAGCNA